jgi:hypothetical protein
MLYSYRHPDLAASVTGHSAVVKLSDHEIAGLAERRRYVRAIPVAAVIESDEADAWDLWNKVVQSTVS